MKTSQAAEAMKRFLSNSFSGKPLYVGVEPLWRCNADCDFCNFRRSNFTPRVEEKKSYADILKSLNPIVVSYAGGEPLIRNDMENLVFEAKHECKIPIVTITTNGSLLTAELYYSLSKAGLDRINISLDFAGIDHDKERGITGLFSKIETFLGEVRGIKGASIGINVILMKDNLPRMSQIMELAKKHDVKVSILPYTSIRVKNNAHEIPKQEALLAITGLREKYGKHLSNSPSYLNNLNSYMLGKKIGKCDAGRSFLWVLPDGRLTACNINSSPMASLKELRVFKNSNSCQECYLPCRGESEIASGHPISVIPHYFAQKLYRMSSNSLRS